MGAVRRLACRLNVEHQELDHLGYRTERRERFTPVFFRGKVRELQRHGVDQLDHIAHAEGEHERPNVPERARD